MTWTIVILIVSALLLTYWVRECLALLKREQGESETSPATVKSPELLVERAFAGK